MSYVLAGASLSKLVLASDCINTDKETLGEAYIGRSESEIAPGLRWFYCAGLGIALGCMGNFPSPSWPDTPVSRLPQAAYFRQASSP